MYRRGMASEARGVVNRGESAMSGRSNFVAIKSSKRAVPRYQGTLSFQMKPNFTF
jgi:hypothetical protein